MYLYIHNRGNHQAPKYLFVHTRAPAKAHNESAYDFPGPTPVPALLSRPFLEACYHSALTTPLPRQLVLLQHLPPEIVHLLPLCGLAARLAIKISRILHPGALRCGVDGSTTYALRGVVCRVWRPAAWRDGWSGHWCNGARDRPLRWRSRIGKLCGVMGVAADGVARRMERPPLR